jgi:hypothetical protein
VPYLEPIPGNSLLGSPTLADETAFQQRSGALGTTSNSEFLPAGLTRFPAGPPFPGADQGALLDRKLDPGSLPAGAVVRTTQSSQLATALSIDSPTAFVAHFYVFRFPGWSATVDGRPATLGEPGPFSTLTIDIPAGAHTLGLGFGETKRQLAFDITSAVSLCAALGLAGLALGRKNLVRSSTADVVDPEAATPFTPPSPGSSDQPVSNGASILGVLVAVVLAIGLRWIVVDRINTPLVQSIDGQHPPDMVVSSLHRFGGAIDLLGYTAPGSATGGQPIDVELFWRTNAPLAVNYRSFVRIVAPNGRTVIEAGKPHIADFPATRWRVGAYARDVHRVNVPRNLAPGPYRIEVGISDPKTGSKLPIDGAVSSSGTLELAPLNVGPS